MDDRSHQQRREDCAADMPYAATKARKAMAELLDAITQVELLHGHQLGTEKELAIRADQLHSDLADVMEHCRGVLS